MTSLEACDNLAHHGDLGGIGLGWEPDLDPGHGVLVALHDTLVYFVLMLNATFTIWNINMFML